MNLETAQKILEQTKNGYNKIAEHFSATRVWPWKVMDSFFSYLKVGERVLDIGCGNGRLMEVLKNKSIDYVGIDNSEKLIEMAEKKFGIMNKELGIMKQKMDSSFIIHHSKFNFLIADALDLPFPNEEFDAVFMVAVLPHIPSEELQIKALENAYRVLKSGPDVSLISKNKEVGIPTLRRDGYLFITCWNLWQPKYFFANLKNRLKNPKLYQGFDWNDFLISWKSSEREILSQRFYHVFTKKELKKLLERAGFKIEKIFYEYKGEKSNWLKGFNLVAVARVVKI